MVLKNLFDVFCGIQHQVIALFLHIFFDKSDDLPVKWISENGIFEYQHEDSGDGSQSGK